MAAPIISSATSKFGSILRVRCYCLIRKKHHSQANEKSCMLPQERLISTVSMGESGKLCTIANNLHRSLGSTLWTNIRLNTQVHVGQLKTFVRAASANTVTDAELKKQMESLTDSFMETRELLDDARDSFGSVYFNEDLQEAEKSLNDTLTRYAALLEKLSESQKEQVQRSIGLKMEELKAQRGVIEDIIRED